uniref:Gag-Pol polyprotein n=1 Tax=Tanacetum cinerariifolium TaxID=118510 RepID=A0A6L2LQ14_TANCI|nr:Gag-Pol polyprotein [Tanacetum cinerariifolium]
MSTQQDIYVAGFKNRSPMLNKDNYVPWSCRLLRYAKSKPNRKLIYNSIINVPYVRRMIPKPGDPDREVPIAETFHEQTDDELSEKEEIWLRVQQMMKGSDIGIQDKKANASPRSTITGYLHATTTTQQQLQPATIIQRELHATTSAKSQGITDPTTAINMALILMAKAFKLNYLTQPDNNQRILSNPCNRQTSQLEARDEGNAIGNTGNQIRCYNCRGLGHLARNCTARPRERDVAFLQTQLLIAQKEEAGIQLQAEEFDFMAAT